ncbi:SEL1-like repeat protein [Acinetobacter baumannii]
MADLHATGNGVPKDNAKAQDYYLKASAAGE